VIVLYDHTPYPGVVISEADEKVQVKCMYRAGPNCFLWPRIEDIIWYKRCQILEVIPEPQNVTKRHIQVEPKLWASILLKIQA
jgi:hypothetical protein